MTAGIAPAVTDEQHAELVSLQAYAEAAHALYSAAQRMVASAASSWARVHSSERYLRAQIAEMDAAKVEWNAAAEQSVSKYFELYPDRRIG